ncbi:MAG: 50S ribosomal protein L4 [Candidatus Omnitrophica bacterium]|nr:50S ribosomal protein L4 [Candidatus Omnitrophota bacterium]
MKLDVVDITGAKQASYTLDKEAFDGKVNKDALYQVVVAYRANQRRGTASSKTRGETAGSGAKPWRQKGTGRARVGSKRNPLWKGGGAAFGPKPRDYSQKIAKKLRQLALKASLEDSVKKNSVIVLADLTLDSYKTKDMVSVLRNLHLTEYKILLVVTDIGQNVKRSSNNIPNLDVVCADSVSALDILLHDRLLVTKDALEVLTQRITRTFKR